MRIKRLFTQEGQSPYRAVAFKHVSVEICHMEAARRVCIADMEVPSHWSYAASELLAQQFLRKAGVPARLKPVAEEGVPQWLWRSVADVDALKHLPEEEQYGSETSARAAFHRLAGSWTYWGWKQDYFDTEYDARAFYDECCYMLAGQMAAPSSPQWWNTGLHWAYGIDGPAQGHFYVDEATGGVTKSKSAYERPQHHACFIQGVKDDLVNEGGIMNLWEREARVFKYGSGTGSNFSAVRGAGETLSSGVASWGLMPFLAVGDKASSSIQSGGLAQRSDKMVLVDIDHPDIESFIRWKTEEEHKAAALATGSKLLRQHLSRIMQAIQQSEGEGRYAAATNSKLKLAIRQARRAMVPESYIERVIHYARQGYSDIEIPVYEAHRNSEAFSTVSAHQARLGVRVSDDFMKRCESHDRWPLKRRVDGSSAHQVRARSLWDAISQATWACGDPALQFDDTINAWNTCPQNGRVRASNAGGEYLFLDDTAAPTASLNLARFVDEHGEIGVDAIEQAARLFTVALDIAVGMAQYPSKAIARGCSNYRPLGLGFTNLAALLMRQGYGYDSDEGRAIAGAVSALITGSSYAVSSELAKEHGAFPQFRAQRADMLRVLRTQRMLALGRNEHELQIEAEPRALSTECLPDDLLADAVRRVWDMALMWGEEYGYRNAQVTCISPAINISRLMDCDTMGLAPEQVMVKYAPQTQGMFRKYLSPHVQPALTALGYSMTQVADVLRYVQGTGTLKNAAGINHTKLKEKGFTEVELVKIEEALGGCYDIRAAFDPWVIGEAFCRDVLGLSNNQMFDAGFDMLAALGFTADEIRQANISCCGAKTLEGAPHLREEDIAVFDCALPAHGGERCVSAEAQVVMMASVQPFISGGIAHRIHLPHDTSVEECAALNAMAWHMGLKAASFYRDGSALTDVCQPVLEEEKESLEIHKAEIAAVVRPMQIARELAKEVQAREAEMRAGAKFRREMPLRREGYTQKTKIGGQTVYLRTGDYPDGALGEIFLDMPKEHAKFRAMVNQFAISVSVALQYGVPLEAFVSAFRFSQFEPSGKVEGHEAIDTATSVLDYVFRELSLSYLQPEGGESDVPQDNVVSQVVAWERVVEREETSEVVKAEPAVRITPIAYAEPEASNPVVNAVPVPVVKAEEKPAASPIAPMAIRLAEIAAAIAGEKAEESPSISVPAAPAAPTPKPFVEAKLGVKMIVHAAATSEDATDDDISADAWMEVL